MSTTRKKRMTRTYKHGDVVSFVDKGLYVLLKQADDPHLLTPMSLGGTLREEGTLYLNYMSVHDNVSKTGIMYHGNVLGTLKLIGRLIEERNKDAT